MAKIGFIGMGNMAGAIMKGSLKTFAPEDIIFFDASAAQAEKVTAETGVAHVSSNIELVNQVKYIVLAVKPQVLPAVMAEIKGHVKEDQVVISIAAGFAIADLKEGIGEQTRVVRVMPNTPALVGEGMAGVAYDAALFNDEEKAMVETLFTSIGKMELVNENMMDVVASASGCSPAYVYM
ncbi:MAG: NAD(P)-binding domain-containing protein, partial [Lachnospiraceae bacterium]|nr:NAD(P)-binding domain-containing protein [Lachnospiraceae bacterium]